jgi:hypothetical protein
MTNRTVESKLWEPASRAICSLSRAMRAAAGLVLALVVAAACGRPPSGDEIIGRALAALGTEGARANVRSLRTIAEGSGPDGLFVTSVTSIRPDTVYFHQQTGLGTTEIWSTPERTWGGSRREAYAEFGPSVRAFVRNHEFHLLLLDIRARFAGFTLSGTDNVGGESCLRVAMTDEEGNDASVCVSEDDWLPLELTLNSPEADGPIRIEFADWREVDGLELFHSFRLHEGGDDVFTYDYVEISTSSFGQEVEVPAPALPERRR